MTRVAILAASLALLVACSKESSAVREQGDSGFGELSATISFSGTGYTPHDGQDYEFGLVTDCDGCPPDQQGARTHGGDLLEFEFNGVAPGPWEIHLYFDVNDDGGCDANDHMWLYSLGYVEGDMTVNEDHNTTFTDVCSTFTR